MYFGKLARLGKLGKNERLSTALVTVINEVTEKTKILLFKTILMPPKPLILAVETSSRIGSVALALGEEMLAQADFSGPMRHSAEIFPAIRTLLDRFSREAQEIEHIYISIGPGSFTGLRIAVTIAKAMHLASAAKIVAIDTLDVVAANVTALAPEDAVLASSHERRATSPGKIAAILDAKRSQFFIAVYQYASDERQAASCRIWKKTLPDSLMTASQFLEKFTGTGQPVWLLGDGLLYYKDKFKADGIRFLDESYWSPQAEKVHLLGWKKAQVADFANHLTLQPNYLRAPDIKQKKN